MKAHHFMAVVFSMEAGLSLSAVLKEAPTGWYVPASLFIAALYTYLRRD